MKYLFLILLLAAPAQADWRDYHGAFRANQIMLNRPDKGMHMAVSGLSHVLLGAILFSGEKSRRTDVIPTKQSAIVTSLLLVFAAGVIKETMDPRFDPGDIVANGIGIAFGTVFLEIAL